MKQGREDGVSGDISINMNNLCAVVNTHNHTHMYNIHNSSMRTHTHTHTHTHNRMWLHSRKKQMKEENVPLVPNKQPVKNPMYFGH